MSYKREQISTDPLGWAPSLKKSFEDLYADPIWKWSENDRCPWNRLSRNCDCKENQLWGLFVDNLEYYSFEQVYWVIVLIEKEMKKNSYTINY